MVGLGTLINLATILGGAAVGLVVGTRIPERARVTMLHGVGLAVLALGVRQASGTANLVIPLVSVVVGGLLGELAGVEERLAVVGERIRARVDRPVDITVEGVVERELPEDAPATNTALRAEPADTHHRFVEGFVVASLLYVVGPLAILGSIADGRAGDIDLLVVKAALDGLVSIIFAATMGWGVAFSIIPVAIYQGVITLLAGQADVVLSDRMILELTATGGLLVMGIGIRLLDVKAVRVASFLPALAIAPLLVGIFAR
ncbi:MAG: DUF554 domain-containing protein [Acidimicrobiales bacterium]